jgi:hypothetical protein
MPYVPRTDPVDVTVLLATHRGLRRDLDRFVAAATHTPADDRSAWRPLVQRWALFRRILHDHHARLWPAQPSEVAAEELEPLLDRVSDGLARMSVSGNDDTRAAVEVRLVAARERIARHLDRVERDVLPRPRQHLSGVHRPRDVAWLLHDLPDPAASRVLAGAPAIRLLWWLCLRRRFARRERRTFPA